MFRCRFWFLNYRCVDQIGLLCCLGSGPAGDGERAAGEGTHTLAKAGIVAILSKKRKGMIYWTYKKRTKGQQT